MTDKVREEGNSRINNIVKYVVCAQSAKIKLHRKQVLWSRDRQMTKFQTRLRQYETFVLLFLDRSLYVHTYMFVFWGYICTTSVPCAMTQQRIKC